jgi:hypothetical protein
MRSIVVPLELTVRLARVVEGVGNTNVLPLPERGGVLQRTCSVECLPVNSEKASAIFEFPDTLDIEQVVPF